MSVERREVPPAESERETPEKKRYRLGPLLQASLEVWNNPEADLRKGALTVTQRFDDGAVHEIHDMVASDIDGDGVELNEVMPDGQPGYSAWMSWDSIVEVVKSDPDEE